jgi:UDP-N-acetylmuramoyl-L-alanyl-D-glutamate--2,6-diaminopimelate ligase
MLGFLRRLIQPAWRRPYYLALAWLAAWRFGFPSRHVVVIGVTGTDGKTTTATLLASALGEKAGLSSTVWFRVGERQWLNESHMTMPGRFQLQRLLRQMVQAGARYAVLEVSSEGLAQGRLTGIDVDVAVLTNITPEHLRSHGTFEKYQAAKRILFSSLTRSRRKRIAGQDIRKMVVVNGDDPAAPEFLSVTADTKIATSILTAASTGLGAEMYVATQIKLDEQRSGFSVRGEHYTVNLPGEYNVANAVQAITVALQLGHSPSAIRVGLEKVTAIPGRFERIDAGQGREVIIDYALTPAALKKFYEAVTARGAKQIVAVFGAAGGGRDAWKRPQLGQIAAEFAAHIILTSDDPFDEDPMTIAAEIKAGITTNVPTEIIVDRRAAIQRALSLVQPGDTIVLTGMGSETSMNLAGGKQVAWNDAQVVRELLGQK